jgi:hypothetical protein
VRRTLRKLKIRRSPFDVRDIRDGMNVELEHGTVSQLTNITNDDPILTIKIALAHLMEDENYYRKLKRLGV